jgi:hypothetical protein
MSMKLCLFCKTEFPVMSNAQTHCSPKCRKDSKKSWTEKILTCPICKTNFALKNGRGVWRSKYCSSKKCKSAGAKKLRDENPERVKQYYEKYNRTTKKEGIAADRANGVCFFCRKSSKVVSISGRCESCKSKKNQLGKESFRKIRREVINALGGKCACCGEMEFQFLAIDHIHGGGSKEKAALKKRGTGSFFPAYVKSLGCPKDKYRVLCHNCNQSLGHYGNCPHGMTQVRWHRNQWTKE